MTERIIMFVYNNIEFDGRVQRSIKALSNYNIILITQNGVINAKNTLVIDCKLKKLGLFSYIKFIAKIIEIKKKYNDIGLVYGHDYYSALPLLFFPKKKYKKIYDAHELYIPDNRDSITVREKIFRFFEKQTLKKTNLVFTANEDRSVLMQKYYGLNELPVSIQNIPNPEDFSLNSPIFLDFSKWNFKIKLVYIGIIDFSRRINKFIDYVKNKRDICIIFIGTGPNLNDLYEIAHVHSNIIVLGQMKKTEMYSIVTGCDFGIVSYSDKGYNNIYCAPNKIYEYAYLNIPIISLSNPTIEKILFNYQIGECNDNMDMLFNSLKQKFKYISEIKRFTVEQSWSNEEKKMLESINKMNDYR